MSNAQTPDPLQLRPAVDRETGEPVCLLTWGDKAGKLTPDEVRAQALHWIQVAEAATTEAAIRRTCERLELPDGSAEAFTVDVAAVRKEL